MEIENSMYEKDLMVLFNDEKFQSIHQIERGFVAPQKVEKNAILFISLNPSYNSKLNAGFYDLPQKQINGFFKRFSELGEYCSEKWTHWDLLAIRESSQKNILALEKSPLGLAFIWENLQLSKKIIECLEPKLIIVVNTFARKYLGKDEYNGQNKWLEYHFGAMHSDGSYTIKNKESNLQGVPVLFSGMLSGTSPLDNGSFERLKWHAKLLLDRNSKIV